MKDFDLPDFDTSIIDGKFPIEPEYDYKKERESGQDKYRNLNSDQKYVVDIIINAVNNPVGKNVFYLDGPEGTGKTYVFTTILHILRSQNKKCLPVAFSGIAATLLDGGRIKNLILIERFKIPINSNIDSSSHITLGSPPANLLKEIDLIIWDEAPMTKIMILS